MHVRADQKFVSNICLIVWKVRVLSYKFFISTTQKLTSRGLASRFSEGGRSALNGAVFNVMLVFPWQGVNIQQSLKYFQKIDVYVR